VRRSNETLYRNRLHKSAIMLTRIRITIFLISLLLASRNTSHYCEPTAIPSTGKSSKHAPKEWRVSVRSLWDFVEFKRVTLFSFAGTVAKRCAFNRL